MSDREKPLRNHIKQFREEHGWSQQELAERARLSRAGVSAIEIGKLVPSTAAALSLARIFSCQVEDIFQLEVAEEWRWAWSPSHEPCRYWRAEVGNNLFLFPAEPSPLGTLPHDGLYRDDSFFDRMSPDPTRTLVVASCDPAIGILASEFARTTNFRMLVLPRSSLQSLKLLRDGLVHVAGLHLAAIHEPEKNASIAHEVLNVPFRLLRVANWQEGLVLASGLGLSTVKQALAADLRWINREPGSGARQVLDEVFQDAPVPQAIPCTCDHNGVVTAVQSGLADVGVSVALAAEGAGLDFISIRKEAYDLCIPEAFEDDPRVRALIDVVRSKLFKSLLGDLPGYDNKQTGEMTNLR